MDIKEREILMWEAARNRDDKAFLDIVDKDAVMICGGFRCSGFDYSQIIREFDLAEYKITGFEKIMETENICQVHYVISTTVSDKRNVDLEGEFHITSTWKKVENTWKLIFNMDSRIVNFQ